MSQCHKLQRKNANLRRLAFLVTVLLAFYCCDLFAELYLSVLYIQTLGGTLAQLASLHVVVAVGAVAVNGVYGADAGGLIRIAIVTLEAASREVLYFCVFLAVFLVDELCCEGIVAVALVGHEEGAEGADVGALIAGGIADAAELAVVRQCVSLQLGCHVVADDIEGTAPESHLLATDCRVVAPLKHLVAVGGIAMHQHIACIEFQLALIFFF